MESKTKKMIPRPIRLSFVMIAAGVLCIAQCRAALPDIFEKCCDVGRQWFTTNRESCTVYPSPVSGVQSSDRSACGSVIDVCCIAQRHEKHCTTGKQSARIRRSCDGLSSRPGSEQARECCHCCNLGITAHEAGLPCSLMSRFSTNCDAAFVECCQNGRQPPPTRQPGSNLTDRAQQAVTVPTTATTVLPAVLGTAADPLGICAKFPGQLCAHVCINTPDSYECACNPGFTLQSDRRTCRQDETGSRCDVSNPCQHQCIDTGVSVHCRCFDGFVLESDGRNCRDIDECSLRQHTCNQQQRCVNLEGSYSCEGPSGPTTSRCAVGFSLNSNTDRCEDIDECSISLDNPCADQPGQICINTPGSFVCRTGSTSITGGGSRRSDNEDESRSNEQGANSAVREPTSTTTRSDDDEAVRDPAEVDSGGENEEVVDEATLSSGTMTTTPRAHHRHHLSHSRPQGQDRGAVNCGTGFQYNPTIGQCQDVDECQSSEVRWSCSLPHQQCRNYPGSYRCVNMCPYGYRYDAARHHCEDINECALNRDTCVEGQTCENTIGSYACRRAVSCGTGYTLDQSSQSCLDDDECQLGTHNCGVARNCHNIPGSFRCVPKECPRGYRLDFRTGNCDPVDCQRGFEADETGNCIDINECQQRPPVCRQNQECRNTQGSYTCRNLLTCGAGYELSSDGSRCEDIDECSRGAHDCTGALMHCVNRQGSYLCECAEGFQVNHASRSCEDVDECSFGGHVCAQNARCDNTHGSYRCICKDGFEEDADGRSCKDVDECARPGMCQHTCRNTWGSFQCSCDEGYQLGTDGRTCDDVDECREAAERGLHVCIGQCENTHGSFACSCPSGYQMSADGRTCQDIDECALRSTTCQGSDDVCVNTRGGFKCRAVTCPKGFIKSPTAGNRNNNVKCQRKTFLCPQGDVECLYAPLSYSTNFITFPSKIRIPADLFTMRGPLSPYRRLAFDLKLITAEDPRNGQQRVGRNQFTVNQLRDNEAVIQLLNEIDGPQDIELQLDMNIYSREFRQNDEEVFFGTAVAKIFIFVTGEDW